MGEMAVLHAYTVDVNGNIVTKPVLGVDSGDGKTVKVSTDATATINAGDLRLGAVEIQDKTTGDRACVFNNKHLGVATENRDTIKTNQKNVALAGTAEQLPAQAVPNGYKLVIKAKKANTSTIHVGGTKADAEGAATHYKLEPDESISLGVKNFDDVWIDAAVGGEGVELIVET